MSLVLVVTIYPLPEYRDELIDVLVATVEGVHSEAGCELYALTEGSDELVLIEKWASAEAHQAHSASDAVKNLHLALAGKVAREAHAQVLQEHPAGTREQGQL